MAEYLAPGVFIEEIDSGSKPIEGVGVNTAAFIGYAKSGDFDKPTFISNWSQFCQAFGEPEAEYLTELSKSFNQTKYSLMKEKRDSKKTWADFGRWKVEMRERENKSEAKVVQDAWRKFAEETTNLSKLVNTPYFEESYLAYAVRGYYDNGGGRAYIVRVARPDDLSLLQEVELKSLNGSAAPAPKAAALNLAPLTIRALNAGPQSGDLKVEVQHIGGNDEFRLKISQGEVREEFPIEPDKGATADAIVDMLKHSKLISAEVQPRPAGRAAAVATRPKPEPFVFEAASLGTTAVVPATGADAMKKVAKTLLDGVNPDDFSGEIGEHKGVRGLALIEDINMISAPDLMAGLYARQSYFEEDQRGKKVQKFWPEEISVEAYNEKKQTILDWQVNLVGYCEKSGDRMAILDSLPNLSPQEVRDITNNTSYNCSHGQAAIYYPWIKVSDPLDKGKQRLIPPSGHIAGVYARVGADRGVHKAPANEGIIGAVALERDITKGEQETLNPDGINCIRAFPGQGIKVWGARTLATVGNPSWKYVNVRRLFNYLEKSMERGMQWVVFEPNDHDLWSRVRRNLSAFLWTEWKEGKLFGQTPADAFYVKCDAETNPQEMIDLGRLYVEIGVNPVKPAEFVIVRIGQWSGGGNTAES